MIQYVLHKLWTAQIVDTVRQKEVGRLPVYRIHLVHHICMVDHVADLQDTAYVVRQ